MNNSAVGMSFQDLLSNQPAPIPDEVVSNNPVAPKYPIFAPPKLPAKLVAGEAIRASLTALSGFKAMDAINASTVPKRFLPDGYSVPTVINPLLSFTTNKYDGFSWSQLFLNRDLSPDFVERASERAREQYCGSGCVVGLVARMKSQLPAPHRRAGPVTQAEFEYVKSILPHMSHPQLSGEGATLQNLNPTLNPDAHPGAPYFKGGVKVRDVFKDEFPRAASYMKILNDEGAGALLTHLNLQKNLPYAVMMLSAKTDIYDRKDFLTKTRPFGITPCALRIIFACITSAFKDTEHNFQSDPDSISAMGFSWTNGGAEKLLGWCKTVRKTGFKALSWGDDQILQITCKDGSAFLLCPDVSGMDMKLQGPTFDLFQAWLLDHFHKNPLPYKDYFTAAGLGHMMEQDGATIDELWTSVILFYVAYVKAHPLLTYKHYLFQQSCGLLSGINGTTLFDMIASGRLHYQIKSVPVPDNLEGVKQYTDAVFEAAIASGFPLKKESMGVQVIREKGEHAHYLLENGKKTFLPDEEAMALPFLGMRLQYKQVDPAHVVGQEPLYILCPYLDPVDVVSHCVLRTPQAKDAEEKAGKQMESLLGMGLMAGANDQAYTYLAGCFNIRTAMKQRATFAMERIHPTMDYDLSQFSNLSEYPPQAYFLKIFATAEDRAKISATLPRASSEEPDEPDSDQDEEDVFMDLPSFKAKKQAAPVKSEEPVLSEPEIPSFKKKKPAQVPRASDVPASSLSTSETRRNVEQIEDSQGATAPPLPPRPTKPPMVKHAKTAPPNQIQRATKEAMYRMSADRKYAAAMDRLLRLTNQRSIMRRGGKLTQHIDGAPDDEQEAAAWADEWAMQLMEEEDRLAALARLQADSERLEESEEEEEEEKYFDPTNARNRQGAGWFMGN
jgi:hypothetical protein